ncbi:flavodoxin domain-containing protein [Gordonia sp. ABSL1-1]|uniref:flavodoxin domain-containing protein n=1 Tax=Gordonia sp. ABSL1-1 TaxID=3053923 RepID=UPI0025729AF9|nr:flavodoxin domain-containing protein [Gordonia sp. ABSL1-1]MDL9936542.1 flavodoxin domain-containing protein [Gordonia sp. ABSL1-1]
MSVVILYGTETGTSELVADAIADVLPADHDPSVYDMSEFAVEDLSADDFLIVVCATYGEGELPTGAAPFAEELDSVEPDLDGLRFAVFGLGDTVYDDTFNRGGEIIAEMLTKRGAVQVGEHGRHDGSSSIKPTAQAEEWAGTVVAVIEAEQVAAG